MGFLNSSVFKFLKTYNKLLIIFLTPILISIIPIVIRTKAASCGFVVILMSIFWLTEALPISITSLLPVLLYPLLGILQADKVAPIYFRDVIMFTFGGLVVAHTIETTKLHERIALFVLLRFGSDPKWLILGFMLVTAFISLWISNTAAFAMMLPVVDAVVQELIKSNSEYHTSDDMNGDIIRMTENKTKDSLFDRNDSTKKGFIISCSYAATIGGTGSLVGTSPNLLLKGHFDKYYPNAHLDFLSFLLYGLPCSILMLIATWIWIIIRWLPRKNLFNRCNFKKKVADAEQSNSLSKLLKEKYTSLGPMSWTQKCVGAVFLLLVLLWITKDLHIVPGWDFIFEEKYLTDATPAIFAVLILFIVPRDNIFSGKPYEHLLSWKALQTELSWDVLLLLGGSLAMADGFQTSGLSDWIGLQLKSFANFRKESILMLVQIITVITTEFTSNTSISSIFLPIMDTIVLQANISPLYLMIPMVMSASSSFMLPISTPHNAIMFATGKIKISDMITTGIVVKIIGVGVIFLATNTWLGSIFDLKTQTFFNTTVTLTSLAPNLTPTTIVTV